MSTPPAPLSNRGARVSTALQSLANLFLKLSIWALPAFFVAILVAFALSPPPDWYFSINARTEATMLELSRERETKWRIEGAILCSTSDSLNPLPRYNFVGTSPCGSDRWFAYALPDPHGNGNTLDEQVLVLGGNQSAPGQAIEATMETRDDRGLQISIRSPHGDLSLGALQLTGLDVINIPAGAQLNLIWPGDSRPRDLVFPFTSTQVRVGRDVTWSDSTMLHEGKLAVFTGSDESVAKRALVEEVDLLPGDQIRLEKFEGKTAFQPKGFFRFDRLQPSESMPTLTAVAFGRAESVKIERFGDSGYDFSPGWWATILQKQNLVIWTTILIGLLSALSSYVGVHSAWVSQCERKRANPVPPGGDTHEA